MKCLNKTVCLVSILIISILSTACGGKDIPLKYGENNMNDHYNINENIDQSTLELFAKNLCATDKNELSTSNIDYNIINSAGVFNMQDCTTVYAYNVNERINPASLTKIMTALVVLDNANLDDIVTVGDIKIEDGAQKFHLAPGDKITVRDLLYIDLVYSANDASVCLAIHVAGSEEAFAELMNQKALELGATNTHFVNSTGLTAENHYTTAYDLYLMFNEALKNDEFRTIISTASYDVTYTKSNGDVTTKTAATTNKYLSGEYKTPGTTVIVGGKTGYTNSAGKCLIIYSTSASGVPYISIIMGAADDNVIYNMMTALCNDTIK